MKNIQDIGVRVTYRNKDMQPTYTKTYSLDEYTEMLRVDLLRVVTFEEFNRIKHKLLDKAGDIGRLPQNIVLRTSEPLNEFMAKLLDGEE